MDFYGPYWPLPLYQFRYCGVLRISPWKLYLYGTIVHPVDTDATSQRFRWYNCILFRPKKYLNMTHWKHFIFYQIQPISFNSIIFTSLGIPKQLLLKIILYFVVVLDRNPTSKPVGNLVVLFYSAT